MKARYNCWKSWERIDDSTNRSSDRLMDGWVLEANGIKEFNGTWCTIFNKEYCVELAM